MANRPSLDDLYSQHAVAQKPSLEQLYSKTQEPVQDPSYGRTILDQTMQGGTFGLGDEISDALGAVGAKAYGTVTGGIDESIPELYNQARDMSKDQLSAETEAYPITSIASNIGGGLLTGGAGATTKAGSALANTLRSGNALSRIGKGAAMGATSGAAFGFGSADDGQRLQGAGQGAVIGGLTGGSIPAAGAALGVARDLISPFTNSGRENIVGKFIQKQSLNPDNMNLDNIQEFIQGSQPTLGQASGDYGLLSLERGLRNQNPAAFAERESLNNVARNQALDAISGSPEEIAIANSTRSNSAKNMYNEAYSNGTVHSDRVKQFLDTPELKSGISRGLKIQRLEAIAEGKPFNPKDYAITDFNDAGDPILEKVPNMRLLDAGKKGLDAMITDNTDPVTGKVNELGRALTMFKNSYLNELDNVNPAYKSARADYTELSKPIEQMETLQGIKGRVMNSVPDPQTGYDYFSQAKLSNVLDKGKSELSKKLNQDQMQVLDNLKKDLDRAAASGASNIRPIGSDTAANLGVKNMLSNIIGDNMADSSIAQTLSRPISFAYKIPEQRMQELLMESILNPKKASSVLGKVKKPSNNKTLKDATRLLSRSASKPMILEVSPRDKVSK